MPVPFLMLMNALRVGFRRRATNFSMFHFFQNSLLVSCPDYREMNMFISMHNQMVSQLENHDRMEPNYCLI